MRDGTPSDADVNLLLIERSPERARATMSAIFGQWGHGITLVHCSSGPQALRSLKTERFDVILAETESLDGFAGDEEAAFGALANASDGALIIALSDGGSVSLAVAAMRAGMRTIGVMIRWKPVGGGACRGERPTGRLHERR